MHAVMVQKQAETIGSKLGCRALLRKLLMRAGTGHDSIKSWWATSLPLQNTLHLEDIHLLPVSCKHGAFNHLGLQQGVETEIKRVAGYKALQLQV